VNGTLITRLWRGEHDLHDTFWRYVIVYGLAVNMATSIAFMTLISMDRPIAAAFVGYCLSIPYNVFALIAVWRSAGNYKGMQSTSGFMRIVAVLWMGMLTIT
jgi:hypothetical protein